MGLFDFLFGDSASNVDTALLNKLTPIIVDLLGVDEAEVTMTSDLGNNLGCDEIDLLEILEAIDKQLHYGVPRHEEKNIRTVGDLVRIVKKYNRL